MPKKPPRFYHPELDVLRFFAFFLVFISHALPPINWVHLPPPLKDVLTGLSVGGAYGVDLFFALSSWLITALLLREHRERGRIDVKAFYVRRILRIWPLYFLFLFVFRPAFSLLRPDEMSPLYLAAFSLLAGNWACAAWGYPATVAAPLWSISIEEQFYLAWPFVVSKWIHSLPRFLVGLLAVSFLARWALLALHVAHPGIWCNTLARLDPIAGGALAAFLMDAKAVRIGAPARIALLSGALVIIIAAGRYGSFDGLPSLVSYPMVALASIMMILGALAPLESKRPPILNKIAYLGQISYGLYVFHWAVLQFIQPYNLHPFLHALIGLTGSIFMAALSYRFLESPFLRIKERFTLVRSRPVDVVFQ